LTTKTTTTAHAPGATKQTTELTRMMNEATGTYFKHVVVNDSVTEDQKIDEERLLE